MVERVAFGEPPPGLQQAPGGSGIIPRPAQIPGIAQRRLVFDAPGVARQGGGVGERQALTPENADRVIVAGERMQGGERAAGEKTCVLRRFRRVAG